MSAQKYRRIVAVDFDGTLAVTKFPEIIKPIPKMIRHCRQLQRGGAILILNTCRKGKFAHEYIDDKAINPAREEMWARRVRQLYASRIISAVGIAAVLVTAIEAVLTAIKYFT